MYCIETKNLTKKYKNLIAVNNLNLKIKKNELFSLLGTNGAGKTTTLKMLSTLIPETSGEILINNLNLSQSKDKIKNIINISPQDTAIAKNLTVKENLYFFAGVYEIKKKENKINELIELFKLESVLNQKNIIWWMAKKIINSTITYKWSWNIIFRRTYTRFRCNSKKRIVENNWKP